LCFSPVFDALPAARTLLCLPEKAAFPPNRRKARSAISTSLNWLLSFACSDIELHEPLGSALLLQPDLVQYSHYTYP